MISSSFMTLEIQRAENVTAAGGADARRRQEACGKCDLREECAAKEFKIDANDVARMSRETAPKLHVSPSSPSPLSFPLPLPSLPYSSELETFRRGTGSIKF